MTMKNALNIKFFMKYILTLLSLARVYVSINVNDSAVSYNETTEGSLHSSPSTDSSYGSWDLVWNTGESLFAKQPGARIMHCTFTFNGSLGVYGGMQMNGLMMKDVWMFSPESNTWEEIVVPDNSFTIAHAGHVCFEAHGELYVFGGYTQANLQSSPLASNLMYVLDLLNPTGWVAFASESNKELWPSPRVFSDGALSLSSNRIVIFGGASSNANGEVLDMGDTWAFDLHQKTWEELGVQAKDKTPPGRYNHACALLKYDQEAADDKNEGYEYLVVYGGHRYSTGFFMGETLSDVWLLNLAKGTWEVKQVSASLKRSQHSMVEYNSRLWVFGGMALISAYSYIFNDVLALDPAQGYWLKLDQDGSVDKLLHGGAEPAELFDHHAEVIDGSMYVYGGRHFVRSLWSGSVWRLPLSEIEDERLTAAHPEFLADFSSYALQSMLVSLFVSLLALALAIAFMLCHYHRRDGLLRAVLQRETLELMVGDGRPARRRRSTGVARHFLQSLPVISYTEALAKIRPTDSSEIPGARRPSVDEGNENTDDGDKETDRPPENRNSASRSEDHPSSSITQMQHSQHSPNDSQEQEDCCAICLVEYEESTRVKLLECSHFFHSQCIDEWLRVNHSCPLCKSEVGRASRESSGVSQNRQEQTSRHRRRQRQWFFQVQLPQRFSAFNVNTEFQLRGIQRPAAGGIQHNRHVQLENDNEANAMVNTQQPRQSWWRWWSSSASDGGPTNVESNSSSTTSEFELELQQLPDGNHIQTRQSNEMENISNNVVIV